MTSPPQLSEAEWEMMKALWERSPVTAVDLQQRFASTRQWHLKTIRTMLTRLVRKRAVGSRARDGLSFYHPLLSREECSGHATQSFLDRVFDGALAPMVANMVARRALTEDEKRELKRILRESNTEGTS